jgi:hypothetical protein
MMVATACEVASALHYLHDRVGGRGGLQACKPVPASAEAQQGM